MIIERCWCWAWTRYFAVGSKHRLARARLSRPEELWLADAGSPARGGRPDWTRTLHACPVGRLSGFAAGSRTSCFAAEHHAGYRSSASQLFGLDCAPGAYNIVDDNPSEQRVWLPAFARYCGAPEASHVSEAEALVAAGADGVYYATRLRGASNAKARRDLGLSARPLEWLASNAADFGTTRYISAGR